VAKKRELLIAAVRSHRPHAVPGGRLRERDPKERRCQYESCGRAFKPTREWQKFCSSLCRFRAWDEENPRVRIRKTR
jgi:hypothetical protein